MKRGTINRLDTRMSQSRPAGQKNGSNKRNARSAGKAESSSD
jgi:hypothetical protein